MPDSAPIALWSILACIAAFFLGLAGARRAGRLFVLLSEALCRVIHFGACRSCRAACALAAGSGDLDVSALFLVQVPTEITVRVRTAAGLHAVAGRGASGLVLAAVFVRVAYFVAVRARFDVAAAFRVPLGGARAAVLVPLRRGSLDVPTLLEI
jgi:hypothetical protein